MHCDTATIVTTAHTRLDDAPYGGVAHRRSPTVRANVPLESMGVTARALVGGMRGMRSHDGFYASHDAHTMELGPPTQIIFRLYSKKKSCLYLGESAPKNASEPEVGSPKRRHLALGA